MQRLLPALTAVFIALTTLGVGVMHGRWSNRWGVPVNPDEVKVRVASVPMAFGDWETRDNQEFSPQIMKQLQCAGYVNRSYVNRKTAEIVQVALLAGPAGPISVHTPEVCYPALALDEAEPAQKDKVRDNDVPREEFRRVLFRSRGLDATYLRVWYAWRGEKGPWSVPNLPRVTLASEPMLYKIQVANASQSEPSTQVEDPCETFLREFLPVLDASLFKAQAKTE